MSFKDSTMQDVSLAILASIGIEPDRVTAIVYSHEVGEIPTLDVTYVVFDVDTSEFVKVKRRWVPE